MSSDREAFIAGIAADPENDLRRLVFADWLEENGEPERAEFVRLQIEGRHLTDPAALKPALDRLFAGQWKKGSIPEKWDGHTGERIAEVLERLHCR